MRVARIAVLTVTVNVNPAVKHNSTELCSVEAKKVKRPHLTGTQTVRHAQQRQPTLYAGTEVLQQQEHKYVQVKRQTDVMNSALVTENFSEHQRLLK
jgi:hypothetical protein